MYSIKKMLTSLYREENESLFGSTLIHDHAILESFINNPDNPYLVSFPRTGSHWLRMLMEIYFERPSLVRVFYYPERTDFLTLHTHDMDLDVERGNVVYLYREPVSTIYSQMCYYKEKLDDTNRIVYWSETYGRHLEKWLHTESFSERKVTIRYEMLCNDLCSEFEKITSFFGVDLNKDRLMSAARKVTKVEVKAKTTDDTQVINLKNSYSIKRKNFQEDYSELVWNNLLLGRLHLKSYFEYLKGTN